MRKLVNAIALAVLVTMLASCYLFLSPEERYALEHCGSAELVDTCI